MAEELQRRSHRLVLEPHRAALGAWLPLFDDLADDGFFPVNLEHPEQLAEVVATIAQLRQDTTAPYDVAVGLPPGADPAPWAKAGATWWMPDFPPETLSLDQVRGVLRDGPAPP